MAQINYSEGDEKDEPISIDSGQSGGANLSQGSQSKGPIEMPSEPKLKLEIAPMPEVREPKPELGIESKVENVTEKLENTRKAISTHPALAQKPNVGEDARIVAAIAEFEKKVEKLVEMALHKGPEHAVKVARHLDTSDDFTLDELHDKLMEDELRNQLIKKGLLKEL